MNELYYDHYKETCELQRNNEYVTNQILWNYLYG